MKELVWFLDNREMRRPVQSLGHRNDQDQPSLRLHRRLGICCRSGAWKERRNLKSSDAH